MSPFFTFTPRVKPNVMSYPREADSRAIYERMFALKKCDIIKTECILANYHN